MAHSGSNLPPGLTFPEFINAVGGMDQFNSRESARAAYDVYVADTSRRGTTDSFGVTAPSPPPGATGPMGTPLSPRLDAAAARQPAIVPQGSRPGRFLGPRVDPDQVGFADLVFNPNEALPEFRDAFDFEIPRVVF